MYIFNWIVAIAWIVWLIYWFISAQSAKKDVGSSHWARSWFLRVLIIVLASAGISYFARQAGLDLHEGTGAYANTSLQAFGTILVLLGFWFAVWARIHLGRNWSSHPTHKEDHELVTSGPYHYVRHPIYTGILLSVIGTIFVVGWIWIILLVVFAIMFAWRIPTEEKRS